MSVSDISERRLLLAEVLHVTLLNAKLPDAVELLGLDHFNAVALLVDEQAVLFAFDGLCVLIVDAHLLVLRHLLVQFALVVEELAPALGHLPPLGLFGFALRHNDHHVHLAFAPRLFLHT